MESIQHLLGWAPVPQEEARYPQDCDSDLGREDWVRVHWVMEKFTEELHQQDSQDSLCGVWVSCPWGSTETQDPAKWNLKDPPAFVVGEQSVSLSWWPEVSPPKERELGSPNIYQCPLQPYFSTSSSIPENTGQCQETRRVVRTRAWCYWPLVHGGQGRC